MKDKELEEQIAKAYGGCTKCYGKGYATWRHGESYRSRGVYATHNVRNDIKYCNCDRGKQLSDLIAQERRKAKIEVLEKPILLELHIKQSQDYKQGFRDAVEQVESYRKDKLAELKEDKE